VISNTYKPITHLSTWYPQTVRLKLLQYKHQNDHILNYYYIFMACKAATYSDRQNNVWRNVLMISYN